MYVSSIHIQVLVNGCGFTNLMHIPAHTVGFSSGCSDIAGSLTYLQKSHRKLYHFREDFYRLKGFKLKP